MELFFFLFLSLLGLEPRTSSYILSIPLGLDEIPSLLQINSTLLLWIWYYTVLISSFFFYFPWFSGNCWVFFCSFFGWNIFFSFFLSLLGLEPRTSSYILSIPLGLDEIPSLLQINSTLLLWIWYYAVLISSFLFYFPWFSGNCWVFFCSFFGWNIFFFFFFLSLLGLKPRTSSYILSIPLPFELGLKGNFGLFYLCF